VQTLRQRGVPNIPRPKPVRLSGQGLDGCMCDAYLALVDIKASHCYQTPKVGAANHSVEFLPVRHDDGKHCQGHSRPWVQIENIPGGCTGLFQPVDVGVGKPVKARAQQLWEEWMMYGGVGNSVLRPPSRLLLLTWVTDSASRIRPSPTNIKNSWHCAGYSYLPEVLQQEGNKVAGEVQHEDKVQVNAENQQE
jgi:hypothetical protein